MSEQSQKRITVFTGHYGSGKTEIAVNYVLQCQHDYSETTIVDLDFVNPYFRSREARKMLESTGIKVVASAEEYFDTDVPALSPLIPGVLKNANSRVIVDLGGDDTGARAIGRFKSYIPESDYELCFVVNPYRPFTSGIEEVKSVLSAIEKSSRLKVSSLVSNPNLLRETTVRDVLDGHRTVTQWAEELGYAVKFLAVEERFCENPDIKNIGTPVLKINRTMLVPWE